MATVISLDYNLAVDNIDERKSLLETKSPASTTIIVGTGFIGKDIVTHLSF